MGFAPCSRADETDSEDRLKSIEALLEGIRALSALERSEGIDALSAEARTLFSVEISPLTPIGAELHKARESDDWEKEFEILERWAEHEAVRLAREARRRERLLGE